MRFSPFANASTIFLYRSAQICSCVINLASVSLIIFTSDILRLLNKRQSVVRIEDIIACLAYMVEAEAEVAADVYDSEQYDKRYSIKKD